MSNDWRICTVDQIKADREGATAIGPFGSRMRAELYVAKGVPVIRGNNISDTRALIGDFVFVSEETADELHSCNVFPGDLIFPHRGAIGEVGIVPTGSVNRYMMSTSLMKLSCNKDLVDPLFVFYFFRSSQGRHALLKHASTVGTPGIGQPLTSLRSISLRIPPLPEQRAIAHILGSLDDKIELNRRMNQTLEDIARALFKSWFIDFDPVRAKAAGQPPVGMDAATAALFPDGFEMVEGREVPRGWQVQPLPTVICVNPTRVLRSGALAPYLEMANMPTASARALAWEMRPCGSGMRFINGDVLVARITPCLENGKTAYVDFLDRDQVGWGSTEYIVLRSEAPLPPEYAYYLARSDDFRRYAIRNMSGTSGRQRVAAEAFGAYHVTVPDAKVAVAFGDIAQQVMRAMKHRDEETRTLATLRDTLLPKLIAGEVRTPEAEQITMEASQ